jgi:hypothetical protein
VKAIWRRVGKNSRSVREQVNAAITEKMVPMNSRFQACVLTAGLLVITAPVCSGASEWQRYDNGEDGFTVSMPVIPTRREQVVQATDTLLRTYEALVSEDRTYKFTISVGMPRAGGYYDRGSMDAFLSTFPESMVKGVAEGKLEQSRRMTFREMPAREFRFSHVQMGQPLVTQGIVFMIDGGYMRVSSLTLADDPEGPATHERFINSFQLRPLAFQPSPTKFNDARGISFTPPIGWSKKPQENSNQIASYARMTRWLEVLTAFNAAYTCRAYQAEAKNLGRLLDTQSVMFSGQTVMRLTAYEIVPTYNVKLNSVHYCLDSPHVGAVVFMGTAEDSIFWRYEQLFEGSARTLRIK